MSKTVFGKSSITIDSDIDLIQSFHEIGGPGGPNRILVPIGRIALAMHDQETLDHDGLPDIYLAGETITKSNLRKDSKCQVAGIAEYPGSVSCTITQPLVGISVTDDDRASARFLFHFRTDNPLRLLAREPNWMTENGRERLKNKIIELIATELETIFFNERIQLWSSPDTGETAGELFKQLNNALRAWGLGIDEASPLAIRKYPQQLYSIVGQFKSAERDLLARELETTIVEQTGLEQSDLARIRNISAEKGTGSGLFVIAKEKKDKSKLFAWLESERALTAANFLREIASGNYPAEDVALSEQVVLSAFRNSLLAVGEWRETDWEVADSSLFRQMEMFFKNLSESRA